MKIMTVRRVPGAGNTIARVDVDTGMGIRLFNVAVKRTASGWRVFPPSAFGSATATLSPETAAQIVAAARQAIGEIDLDRAA